MKKRLLISFIITFGINALGLIINLITSLTIHKLFLGVSVPGGDCIEYFGFGIELLDMFAWGPPDKVGVFHEVSFSIGSLIFSFIPIFIIVFIICTIISKLKKKKTS